MESQDHDELPDDETLEQLALAADPDAPIPADAAPFLMAGVTSTLSPWYMPPAVVRLSGWRSRLVVGLVLSFLLIEIAGLCFTYGPVVP